MKVLLAKPRGFCAGVDRAIKIVDLALEVFGPPVYVRKEIVHNSHVVTAFREKGVVFVNELDEVPDGELTILSAHGSPREVFEDAKRRGLRVIDATCPLVTKVHMEVHRSARPGDHVILIGHAGHDEVVGTIGQSPEHISLVEDQRQANEVQLPPHDRLTVLTQTTLGVDDTAEVMAVLRDRFPHLKSPADDDICYATQNRQDAVKAMSGQGIDLLLVVGSQNSSNAARLVEVGQARGVPGFLIDGPEEIDPAWLADVESVGITAGASTPEHVVQSVLDRLRELGADAIEYCVTAEEATAFQLPRILKRALEDRSRADSTSQPGGSGEPRRADGQHRRAGGEHRPLAGTPGNGAHEL
ncbi:MAG: 4-hydroxy-3-methylbut-2-enyl diphosphate reductase [Planctomycetota bacterium]